MYKPLSMRVMCKPDIRTLWLGFPPLGVNPEGAGVGEEWRTRKETKVEKEIRVQDGSKSGYVCYRKYLVINSSDSASVEQY